MSELKTIFCNSNSTVSKGAWALGFGALGFGLWRGGEGGNSVSWSGGGKDEEILNEEGNWKKRLQVMRVRVRRVKCWPSLYLTFYQGRKEGT